MLISLVVIALALLLAPLVAPYRFEAPQLGGFWRFNIVTGEPRICLGDTRPFLIVCSEDYRPEQQMPTEAADPDKLGFGQRRLGAAGEHQGLTEIDVRVEAPATGPAASSPSRARRADGLSKGYCINPAF